MKTDFDDASESVIAACRQCGDWGWAAPYPNVCPSCGQAALFLARLPPSGAAEEAACGLISYDDLRPVTFAGFPRLVV